MKVWFIVNEFRRRGDENYAMELSPGFWLNEGQAEEELRDLAQNLQGEWVSETNFSAVPDSDLEYDSWYLDSREIKDWAGYIGIESEEDLAA